MSDYVSKTKNFISELEKEEAYVDFVNYKNILEKDADLKSKLELYLKRRFEIQVDTNYGFYNSYEQLLSLNREYKDLLAEPLVQNYLKAELEFSNFVEKVFDEISKSLPLDLSFLK